jgi:hypothetical protein
VQRAVERAEPAGLIKLVVDAETDRILGAAILSSEGGELVQILEFVMRAGVPYTLLKGAVYITLRREFTSACRSSARSALRLARACRGDEWHVDLSFFVILGKLGSYPASPV